MKVASLDFVERLRRKLYGTAIGVASAEIGRSTEGLVWMVSVRDQNMMVVTFQVVVAHGSDAYSDDTCADVARRIRRRLCPTETDEMEIENERLRGLVEQLWKAALEEVAKSEFYVCEWCETSTDNPWALGWKRHSGRYRVDGTPYKYWCCPECGKASDGDVPF